MTGRRPRAQVAALVAVAAGGALLLVALVALAVVGLDRGRHVDAGPAVVAEASVVQRVTSVPASTTTTVGTGSVDATVLPRLVTGATGPGLPTTAGEPTVLFVGAEFCPYCAAERWALVEALSRFGTFSGLQQIRSSEDHIATFSLERARFASRWVGLDAKEEEDQHEMPLQRLSAAEHRAWYSFLPAGASAPSFPFLDLGGSVVATDSLVDPTVLEGQSWSQVADALSDPSSPVARQVDGAANVITAGVCRVTGEQPASVCTGAVQAIGQRFPAWSSPS